jgi:hypothetical protein
LATAFSVDLDVCAWVLSATKGIPFFFLLTLYLALAQLVIPPVYLYLLIPIYHGS